MNTPAQSRIVTPVRVWGRIGLAIAVMFVLAAGAVDVQAKVRIMDGSADADSAPTSATGAADATVASPTEGAGATPASTADGTGTISRLVSKAAAAAAPPPRDLSGLSTAVQAQIASSGANVGVTVVELGGTDPVAWSVNGSEVFTAASTYKLAALMMEAQNIAGGRVDPNGVVCYQEQDYEDGWFDDYADGTCFTRIELATRAGKYSDNTAGHMLVRDVGGVDALNAWAASYGAANSALFVGNTTTSADLAALWVTEAQGKLGGAAAQAWLYPLLMDTRTESGVPAGVGGGVTVVHKTGAVDLVANDAALVTSGPAGPYVLVVMTDGAGGSAGWQLVANISDQVRQFEASRSR